MVYRHFTNGIELCQQKLQGKTKQIQKHIVCCISRSHFLEHTMPLFSKFAHIYTMVERRRRKNI